MRRTGPHFSQVESNIDREPEFRSLPRDARDLWKYLIITGRKARPCDGLVVASLAEVAIDLLWEPPTIEGLPGALPQVRDAFRVLIERRWVLADWSACVLLLPRLLRHRPPANPSVVAGWQSALADVPESPLKAEWLRIAFEVVKELPADDKGKRNRLDTFVELFGEQEPSTLDGVPDGLDTVSQTVLPGLDTPCRHTKTGTLTGTVTGTSARTRVEKEIEIEEEEPGRARHRLVAVCLELWPAWPEEQATSSVMRLKGAGLGLDDTAWERVIRDAYNRADPNLPNTQIHRTIYDQAQYHLRTRERASDGAGDARRLKPLLQVVSEQEGGEGASR